MLNPALTIGAILIGLALVLLVLLKHLYSLDDMDPFSYNNDWDNNLAPEHMPWLPPKQCCDHNAGTTDVIVGCAAGCETIHTLCDQCGDLLKTRTDCI